MDAPIIGFDHYPPVRGEDAGGHPVIGYPDEDSGTFTTLDGTVYDLEDITL